MPPLTAIIVSADWIIATVRKHVVSKETLAGGDKRIGIDKSADLGVVKTAL